MHVITAWKAYRSGANITIAGKNMAGDRILVTGISLIELDGATVVAIGGTTEAPELYQLEV